ncbi:alpha/beta fold hydrolase [Actinoplanes sp. TBRC 11911]|uniref:alpha/beta fold hydrolase n=1 Tax=Actinoplanes sp. TBRC 11911 TaxID=2729386 RepID=UPI00145EE629|nr:alpha/beta hydrolase [Actinoplanes sp. TBRC 11911]NMO49887.1 alpha/beta fold hydrolase [Actinoplanes sp. TBRC 11911]
MTLAGNPPERLRSSRTWGATPYHLTYDRWGTTGRPVLLLHGLLHDRSMWWPLGDALAPYCTLLAVDLPGHGQSRARGNCLPEFLATDLAMLVQAQQLDRAPIVVGHATSAVLADAFANLFAVHALVTLDERNLPARAAPEDLVDESHRRFRDAAILQQYRHSWVRRPATRPRVRLVDRRAADLADDLRAML